MLRVEVDEGLAALADELARRGLSPRRQQRALLVPLTDDSTYDLLRDAVADLRAPLSRLELSRHSVEELFRDSDLMEVSDVR
jgi:ABC-2 type transport system ATP-binding protein